VAFFLDTDIVIHAIDGHTSVLDHLEQNAGNIFISAITLVELQRGLAKASPKAAPRKSRLPLLMGAIPVLAFTQGAALAYGRLILECGWTRSRDFDRMIAAHALQTTSVLVTNNPADFLNVPGLSLATWTV
jgi:tRNA(fMet)-specific endonuclease VapC